MTRPMTRSSNVSRDVGGTEDVKGDSTPKPPADDDAGFVAPPSRGEIPRLVRTGSKGQPVTILFLSGHSRAHGALALDEEYRAIEQRIRAARHRDAFRLIPKLAVRRSDLQDALLEHEPDIVHFACHGSRDAELLLPGDGPLAEPVPAEALQTVFRVLCDNVALVVLNACFAGEQAALIRRSTGLAIGMRALVADHAAVVFASALYGALAYGRSVRDAFDLGVAALDGREREAPQLFAERGVDPHAVRFADRRRPRGLHAAMVAAMVAALAVAAGAAGWFLWLRPPPDGSSWVMPSQPAASRAAPASQAPPPPSRRMVRIAVAELIHTAGRSPRATDCAIGLAAEGCGPAGGAAASGPLRIESFELDTQEVSNAELAAWLNTSSEPWEPDSQGAVVMHRGDGGALPVVWASGDCFGALAIRNGRVVVAPDKAHWPAVCVTWYGAAEYCRAQHKRLPTNAEWELAAAGRDGRPFPWGDRAPEPDVVSFGARDGAAAHPRDVASSPLDVSPDGVYDLGGSVAEWIDDGAGGPAGCPHGGPGTALRTIRGGSWASRDVCHLLAASCKRISACRFGKDVGFRCARSVVEHEPAGGGP